MESGDLSSAQYRKYLTATLGGLILVMVTSLLWGVLVLEEQLKLRKLSLYESVQLQQKTERIDEFHRLIGFGGLIHHFKNYVLRQDDVYIDRFDADLAKVRSLQTGLRQSLDTPEQIAAFDSVLETIARYEINLRLAEVLVADGKGVMEVDGAVRIDDESALEAIARLDELVNEQLRDVNERQQTISAAMERELRSGLFLILPLLVLGGLFVVIIRRLRTAHEGLESTRNELNLLLETTPNPILAVDAEGRIFKGNQSAIDYFGYGEGLIGKTVESLMPEKYRNAHGHMRSNYFQNPRVRSMAPDRRIPALLASGQIREIAVRLGYARHGSEPFSVISIRDVTDENLFRATAEKMQQRIEFASKVASFSLWEWDLEADSILLSRDALHKEPFSGTYRQWCQTIHPDDVNRVDDSIREGILKKKPVEVEFRRLMEDGGICDLQLSAGIQMGESGMPRLVIGILNDVTAARKSQKLVENARLQAVRANQSKSRFLASMSHEIRTPMNAILGLLLLLDDSELEDRQKQLVSSAHMSAKTLLNILNDILDFSKLEEGKFELHKRPFCLDQLLRQTMDLFSAAAYQKKLVLRLCVSPRVHTRLIGDQERMAQVISNLLSNAIKFADSGAVTLRIFNVQKRDTACTLRFMVEDEGVGMTAEECEHVMEPFAQADMTSTRAHGGTGLGLPICTALVSMMGGELSVASEQGHGTRVEFDLPFALQERSDCYEQFAGLPVTAILLFKDSVLADSLKQHLVCWGAAVHQCKDVSSLERALAIPDQRRRVLVSDFGARGTQTDLEAMGGVWLSGKTDQDGRLIMSASLEQRNKANTLLGSLNPLLISECPTPTDLHAAIQGEPDDRSGATILPNMVAEAAEIASNCRGAHLLVVEDVQTNQMIALDLLERMGMTADVAPNGRLAVDFVNQNQYDAVLMDFHMPVMGGLEAAKLIRQDEQHRQLPIIAMTAAAYEDDRIRAMAAGMDGFLTKPIDIVALATTLSELLSNRSFGQSSTKKSDGEPPDDQPRVLSRPSDYKLLEHLPPQVDHEAVRKAYGDSLQIYLRCLRTFATEFETWNVEVKKAINENSASSLSALLHKLKGASSNIMVPQLADKAASLMDEMVHASPDTEGAEEALIGLSQQLLKVIEAIQKISDEVGPDDVLSADPKQEKSDFMAAFHQSLQNQRFIPPDILSAWLSLLPESLDQSLVGRLKESVELFDYADAIQCLDLIETLMDQEGLSMASVWDL